MSGGLRRGTPRCLFPGNTTVKGLRTCLHGGGGPQTGEVTCGGSPHLSCKRDQIKMRDYMDWRVTPPTCGPPPPRKQALRRSLVLRWISISCNFYVCTHKNFTRGNKLEVMYERPLNFYVYAWPSINCLYFIYARMNVKITQQWK